MIKKLLVLFLGVVVAFIAFSSFAAKPPEYLDIKDFKKCLATQKYDTWDGWCMPAKKPDECPEASWQKLLALTIQEKLPVCPGE